MGRPEQRVTQPNGDQTAPPLQRQRALTSCFVGDERVGRALKTKVLSFLKRNAGATRRHPRAWVQEMLASRRAPTRVRAFRSGRSPAGESPAAGCCRRPQSPASAAHPAASPERHRAGIGMFYDVIPFLTDANSVTR